MATKVDINGTMKSYNQINFNDILTFCKNNSEVAWLKEIGSREVESKDGKKRRLTFVEIKKDFCIKFFPEIAPKEKEAKLTMYDLIDAL